MDFKETSLWKHAFCEKYKVASSNSALSRLASAFDTARDRIKPIVRQAHIDCKGLTIHDETHLDALWQVGSIIAGENYTINPVEAFVFGCSVLFHDSALAISAYEGGLEEIKNSSEYQRAIFLLSNEGKGGEKEIASDNIEKIAIFIALRSLHARQAIKLVDREWRAPNNTGQVRIIEDLELFEYYGQSIGRIAQSHHWDVDRLPNEFSNVKAPPPSLPESWTLNELKVALLLRCADAAHIDQRRAPLMDYIINKPQGLSKAHWEFQSHIGVPINVNHSIVYSSGRDFGKSEAEAWWLCFDTCRMISEELKNAEALLSEMGSEPFDATRVEGVQRPRSFSKFVKCDGWEPVDAEVRVSDPVHLAQTLGGPNLYGYGFQAPIRELLQNAVDSATLRGTIGRDGYVPNVRLIISEEAGKIILTVEDNGIGMSERVLTKRLLDFGRSGWRSEEVAHDNPGVKLAGTKISGKFGIGFFATFLLGDEITVITRRFRDGIEKGLALEFVGLSRRPILRKATEEEQEDNFTTKVRVVISEKISKSFFTSGVMGPSNNRSLSRTPQSSLDFYEYIKWLIVSCDVGVTIVDKIGDKVIEHLPNWQARSSEEFLNDLIGKGTIPHARTIIAQYSNKLSVMSDENGLEVGRAAIRVNSRGGGVTQLSFARVGGLSYPSGGGATMGSSNTSAVPPFIGIISGDTDIATRGRATPRISAFALKNWATKQAESALEGNFSALEQIELARAVYWAGGDPLTLPIGFYDGKLVDTKFLKDKLLSGLELFLPIAPAQRLRDMSWMQLSELRIRFMTESMSAKCCIMTCWDREQIFPPTIQDNEEIELSVNEILSGIKLEKFDLGSYSILLDWLEKEGRRAKYQFSSRKIFNSGLDSANTFGFVLTVE